MKKRLLNFIIVLLVLALLVSAGVAVYNALQSKKDAEAIAGQAAIKPEIIEENGNPLMKFSDLLAANSEIVGWLTLDGTVIDYPVVRHIQTEDDGSGNSFYLSHDAEKNTNRNGAIFLDWRNNADFSDFNNMIYGHQTTALLMFHDLINYKDKAFFDRYQTGRLYTPQKTYELELFAVAVIEDTNELYKYDFVSLNERDAYVANIQRNATFFRDIGLVPTDKLVMLSTCSYEFTSARTVVFAKLVG